ncbi:hypothetical protein F2Q69_00041755 [Brassica cretica]|uniref:Uncharacterized protein n=1 Tax=Brassica cretica TaxID=69181 RepID=A0A8S9N9N2_BRACR|nr:hypothetical protein F2Q69_00041755 [Brassica cretica]
MPKKIDELRNRYDRRAYGNAKIVKISEDVSIHKHRRVDENAWTNCRIDVSEKLGRYVATELRLELGRYVATEIRLELGRYVATGRRACSVVV